MKETIPKIVTWAIIALIGLTLEMRLRVGEQAKDLDSIKAQLIETSKIARDSWEEQLRRKDVIDWVREFRAVNGWDGSTPKNYVIRREKSKD